MSDKIISCAKDKEKSRKGYKYLSQTDRIAIQAKLEEKKLDSKITISTIAKGLNRSTSTIYNEITRSGFTQETYNSLIAENKYSERRVNKKNKLKGNRILNKEKSLLEKVINFLKKKYSPLNISKILLKEGIKISYNTIYNYAYYLASLGKIEFSKLLYNKHKKRKKQGNNNKKGKIPNRISIHERPKEVDEKKRFGDFEADLVCGGKTYLLTVVDRVTRKGFVKKLFSKEAEETKNAIIKILKKIKSKVKTITFDNGLEFAQHEEIAKELNCETYFCDPYCSSQKGAVENFNKMIRKFLPKGTNFKNIHYDKINSIVNTINNYPRKVLDFQSANDVFDVFHS